MVEAEKRGKDGDEGMGMGWLGRKTGRGEGEGREGGEGGEGECCWLNQIRRIETEKLKLKFRVRSWERGRESRKIHGHRWQWNKVSRCLS